MPVTVRELIQKLSILDQDSVVELNIFGDSPDDPVYASLVGIVTEEGKTLLTDVHGDL